MSAATYSTSYPAAAAVAGSVPTATKQKTRNLSTFDYLEVLQTEYVVAQLRKKIYPHVKDKNFYKRTMEHKQTKIEDIDSRNSLPTIFNDTKVKEAIYARVFLPQGLPNFHYKDEAVRAELEAKDIANYYSPEAEVKVVQRDGNLRFGTLSHANVAADMAYVMYRDEKQPDVCTLSDLTRIL